MIYIRGIRYTDNKDKKEPYYIPMVYASDIYHSGLHCDETVHEQYNCQSNITYNINNNYIETSTKDGYVQIAYQAIKTDEEGFPMIPDDTKVRMALKYFIL